VRDKLEQAIAFYEATNERPLERIQTGKVCQSVDRQLQLPKRIGFALTSSVFSLVSIECVSHAFLYPVFPVLCGSFYIRLQVTIFPDATEGIAGETTTWLGYFQRILAPEMYGFEKVDAIKHYTDRLTELNNKVQCSASTWSADHVMFFQCTNS
jgi:hypothetical protein